MSDGDLGPVEARARPETGPVRMDGLYVDAVYWVLVVDDREANRFALRKSLESVRGLDVVECEDGAQALELLAQVDFSLVLLDADMPGVDGYEVARSIANMELRRQVPVIMLTGQGTLAAERAYDAGAVDFIVKPVAPDILRNKVTQFLKLLSVKSQLAFATEQQEALLNAVGDGVMEIDAFGRIAYVNETALNLLGSEHGLVEDSLVESWFERGTGAVDRDWLLTLSAQAASGLPVTVGNIFMSQGEVRTPVEWTCAVSRGSDGMLIVLFRDITERLETEKRLIRLANYDPLTQLHNRAAFHDCLQRAISRSARFASSVAVLMLDLDHFKHVNDTLGHDVGDALLVEVSARLKGLLRQSDTGARLGGDEFVLILEDTALSNSDVYEVAERIVSVVAEPYSIDGMQLEIETSCGIALCHAGDTDLKTVVKRADIALYAAKAAGRNTFRLYHKHMSESTEHNARLERQIRRMVHDGNLQVCYQPQMSLTDGLRGFEALLRWPDGTTTESMTVDEFIQMAEQSTLIEQVGEFVMETVCAQMAEWVDMLTELNLSVAINVSMRELANPLFAEKVLRVVEAHDVDPQRIKIEISESAIPLDRARMLDALQEFQALGFRLSLDDFGTGYSYLLHLQKIALDELKIDRCFISQLGLDEKNDTLVDAIIAMAFSFGIDLIAEGVENEDQSLWLRTMGCDVQQGFLFGAAMSAERAGELMARVGNRAT